MEEGCNRWPPFSNNFIKIQQILSYFLIPLRELQVAMGGQMQTTDAVYVFAEYFYTANWLVDCKYALTRRNT